MTEQAKADEALRGAAMRGTRLTPGAAPSKRKTAVIVVHGMGEQQPLETIKSFVDTVYQRDTTKARNKHKRPEKLSIAVVPDSAFASSELRRLSTQDDGPPKRTDFFEFYWADIMDGTPVELVTSWIDGLLLRSPFRVPFHLRVVLAWFLLWALAGVVVISAAATAYPQVADSVGALKDFLALVSHNRVLIGQVIFGLAALVLVVRMFMGMLGGEAKLEAADLARPAVLVAGGALLALWPVSFTIEAHVVAGGVTAGMAWLMHALVAPYLGDVVRYVRATPSTVGRRKLIRERGLALLEAIHAKRLNSTDDWQFVNASPHDEPPAYDRIVLVAHSLGCFVAYDMLQMFWEKYGPTHHQSWLPNAGGMQTALEKVDEFVQKAWVPGKTGSYDPQEFRKAQDKLREALAKAAPHWRISDFITLGSPLGHMEFLTTDGAVDLESSFVARRFAACPPRPDPLLGSMLYSTVTDGPKFPHFAAQFAAVRWTNICDESWFPLTGDLISGKLRPIFGDGIAEHDDKVERGWPGPFRRVFTHTEYWKWQDRYLKTGIPDHIKHLREALKLGT